MSEPEPEFVPGDSGVYEDGVPQSEFLDKGFWSDAGIPLIILSVFFITGKSTTRKNNKMDKTIYQFSDTISYTMVLFVCTRSSKQV